MSKPFSHCMIDGVVSPLDEAVMPLTSIEFSYGFGVYETVRVVHDKPWFLHQHAQRLLSSAALIGLAHTLGIERIEHDVQMLSTLLQADTYNLKFLLIGGKTAHDARFFILPSSPVFPDKRWCRDGVQVCTMRHERTLPQAKTLSMLGSYLGYRLAKEKHCYDCLLINHRGEITEGTRTNVHALRGSTIISPPEDDILPGIQRSLMLRAARERGFGFEYSPIAAKDIASFDAFFLTSTSSKVLPIRQIDDEVIPVSDDLQRLVKAFDAFLDAQNGELRA